MQRFRQFISNLNPTTIIWSLASLGLLLGAASFVLALTTATSPAIDWLVSFLQNLSAGMFGSAVTFWLIDVVFGGHKAQEAEEKMEREYKQRIIEQMRSQSNDAALEAVRIAKDKGWLTDGSLEGVNLSQAALQGVRFWDADLRRAVLIGTNLKEAKLRKIDLREAQMWAASLQGANMPWANLEGAQIAWAGMQQAQLNNANLYKAELGASHLEGADLSGANMEGAKLRTINVHVDAGISFVETIFDKNTILPDGTNWKPKTDLTRFTDQAHRRFWRSDDPLSPAYYDGKNPEESSEAARR